MSKLDDFKKFVSNHSEFVDYVRDNNVTWQTFYELYDMYGEDEKIWSKYTKNTINDIKDTINIKGLLNTIKNINLDTLEENINSIQKAVSLVEELTRPTQKEDLDIKKVSNINKLYGEE